MIAAGTNPAVATAEALLVGSADAARVCGVSRRTFQRLDSEGLVPAPVIIKAGCACRRPGRDYKRPPTPLRRWRLDELREWVALGCPSRERFETLTASRTQAPPTIRRHGAPAVNRTGLEYRSPTIAAELEASR